MDNQNLHPAYPKLVQRLNRLPQGAPPSESLYDILKILFSPREASLVADLPIKPFTVNQAAQNWKMEPLEAHKILDDLASRAILLDYEQPDGSMTYVVPPPMAGFFEFSLMRVRDDIDQQTLAEKYYQYCTVEPEFMHHLFDHQTQMGRVFVNEPLLPDVEVLDFERASEVIRTSTHRGITLCYCRRKTQAMHQECSAPLDICMTFNGPAEALIRHGHARSVEVPEMLDQLQRAYEHNLVQFGENVRHGVSFICNCCGCCCEALVGAHFHQQFSARGRRIRVQRLRQVCSNLSHGSHDPCVQQRSPPAAPHACPAGSGNLPGLWRLRPQLLPRRFKTGTAPTTAGHALQYHPPHCDDGG